MSAPQPSIAVVESYFGPGVVPVIAQTFTPGTGWERTGTRTPVSRAHVHALRTQGITSVALEHGSRVVDFLVDELLRVDRRPPVAGEQTRAAHRIAERHHALRREAREAGRG